MRSLCFAALLSVAAANDLPIRFQTRRSIDSALANIHLKFDNAVNEPVQYTYGSCSAVSPKNSEHRVAVNDGSSHDRLVWQIPTDSPSGGCLSAWSTTSKLMGRSEPVSINRRRAKRAVIAMDNSSNIDAHGPWFDGVELLKGRNLSAVDTAAAKSKEIAIVGTGMAGLMTWLVLHQAGMKNLHLVEAAQRLGGRVHTAYFGEPSERVYQEMGPMRFPKSITNPQTNETYDVQDHKLVFDLAAELNKLNGNDKNFSVDFIKWYQQSQSGLQCADGIRKTDGRCPTLADIDANATLAPLEVEPSTEVQDATAAYRKIFRDPERMKGVATNLFKAYKQWLTSGLNGLPGDSFSELGYLHNQLHYSLNASDQALGGLIPDAGTFWDAIFEGTYFSATDWVTIDGGLNRLPLAFHPLVDNVTSMNRKIKKMSYDEDTKKVQLYWKDDYKQPFQNTSYDYAITTVPMALMRMWELPAFSQTKANAIASWRYVSVCKVALKFKTRFWEHFDQPIYGGCSSTTSAPGVGSICYPSYDLNSTGPGAMLASYTGEDAGLRWSSVLEEEHVAYVVDAMADVHGDVVYEQYTGEYNRRCWLLDEYETVSWGAATMGQRQLYQPTFFQTEKGIIIGGEATSYTSSWISSALESGIRSGVQLLLELGLVDEAKDTVEKWMARWISV